MPTEPDLSVPDDDTSVMLVREISAHIRSGSLDRAEAILRSRLAEQPRFAFGQLLLGMIYTRGKRYDEAVEACERALEINPRLAPAPLQIGRIQFEQDDHAGARRQVDRALDMDPNLAGGQLMLAALALEDDEVEAAEAALSEVLEIRPRHIAARLMLAEIYVDDGRIRKALRLLKAVVKDRPESFIARLRLGRVQAADRRYKAAAKTFQAAAASAARPARLHVLAGDALRCLGREADAGEAYQQALTHQPSLEPALYGLADTQIARGELQAAQQTLLGLLQTHPRAHAVFQRQGLIYAQQGFFELAIRAFRAALREDDSLIRRDPVLAELLAPGVDLATATAQVAERIRALLLPRFAIPDRQTRQRQRDFALHFRQMMPRNHPIPANEQAA